MLNLLNETLDVLAKNGKALKDVELLIDTSQKIAAVVTEAELMKALNVNYDNGWGCEEINTNLRLEGKGFWLERRCYDGAEWWEFKEHVLQCKTVHVEDIIIKN